MGVRLSAFVACLLVTYAPAGLPKLVALLFAMVFGYLMLVYDYVVFTKLFTTWWKLRGKVSWDASPPFLSDLAQKMRVKLNKKRPFGVTESSIGAAADVFHNRVIVSREVLVLPAEERNAVLAHELAHFRPKQGMMLMLLIYVALLGASTMANVNPIIMTIGATALFLMLRTIINWILEYDADNVGSGFSSREGLASALRHLSKPEEYDEPSDTHPSINSRVARLLTPQQPLWMGLSRSLMEIIATKSFREEFLESFIQDLRDHCSTVPKYLRPMVIVTELIKAALIWGRHQH
jgi:hypothetical protein